MAAILDLLIMAAIGGAIFGARQKSMKVGVGNISAKFGAFGRK